MSEEAAHTLATFHRFRRRLAITLLLVVGGSTALFLGVTQRRLHDEALRTHEAEFRQTVERLVAEREQRIRFLTERCLSLVKNVRILASLEDDALDLLYPSARDELRELNPGVATQSVSNFTLQTRFYRFLDRQGKVISPTPATPPGRISIDEARQISLRGTPREVQLGYLHEFGAQKEALEIIATPIASPQNPEGIATLVVGFVGEEVRSGALLRAHWTEGRLYTTGFSPARQRALERYLHEHPESSAESTAPQAVALDGQSFLLFQVALNPGSSYPLVREVVLVSMTELEKRLAQARERILLFGALGLALSLIAAHLIAKALSSPVEQLARTSLEQATQRDAAKAALELTQAELDRAARFSANASHQLKTPIAVLRAGLDELLVHSDLRPEIKMEIERLGEQTQRLTHIVNDLLLLSRLDAGRLRLDFTDVDLVRVVEECVDDLSILPEASDRQWKTHLLPSLLVPGEKRYLVHILRNLLENAVRYNHPGGLIQITLATENDYARLRIGNHGQGIPTGQQTHLFDRFHRAGADVSIPGHGLGLSLARDLARLHRGDVFLAQSGGGWTEFEVNLPLSHGKT